MQTLDLLLAGEGAGCIGEGLVAQHEIAQAAFHRWLELRPVAAQQVAEGDVEASECQPFPQASRLSPSRLIGSRLVPQLHPRNQ